MRRGSSVKGSILILSMWVTAAVGMVLMAQATRVALEMKWIGRLQEKREAWYLAWAGLEAASRRLASDEEAEWDAPAEGWGRPLAEPIPLQDGMFHYEIADESGRIPINAAPADLLARLPGFTPQAAREVVARRGVGEVNGIAHLGEMTAIQGFQKELLPKLETVATSHGSGPVNLNTCSAQVLIVLGLSPRLADEIAAYQAGPDGERGTADDGVFRDVEEIQPVLENNLGLLLPEDQLVLGGLIQAKQIGVRSSFFRIRVRGTSGRHGVDQQATVILERGRPGSLPVVRGWHEA